MSSTLHERNSLCATPSKAGPPIVEEPETLAVSWREGLRTFLRYSETKIRGSTPVAEVPQKLFLFPCFLFFNKKGGWAPWFGRNTLGIADFISHSSGQRTLPQSSNTRAAKDGSGPRPAAQSAKRCFLNCLETSFRPSIRLLSCTASSPLACVLLQLAFVLHSSGQRRFRQSSNTKPVEDGSDRARGRQPRVPNVAFWTA